MKTFLLENYQWLKSLHLIAVIAFMAGMMYLPRLFIYHHQSEKGGEAEGYFLQMERRLLKGIINPSIILLWVLGLLMAWINWPGISAGFWFETKFLLVLLISAIHGYYAGAVKKFARGERVRSEKFWRIINEIPFLILIAITILVLVRPF